MEKVMKRENHKRIFANRDLLLDKVKNIGFDMDYTLAEYKSPQYEKLILKHAFCSIVQFGYPIEVTEAKYDPAFASRGLVFDKKYGNFLKIDPFGNIVKTVYGLKTLHITKSREQYKNRFIDVENSMRYEFFNTLFEFPSMFLISSIVDYFESSNEWRINETETGFINNSTLITYENIFEDVQKVFSHIHHNGSMKQETLDNLEVYVKKDPRLPQMLRQIKDNNRKCFLVTNSDYWYTNNLMTYLFEGASKIDPNLSDDWKTYFDLIVVDSKKPKFFAEGTRMALIDETTGKGKIGVFTGDLSHGKIFTGGSSEIICDILGCVGKEVLYVGDHIFGDILKSKKKQGWRTYLVIPEMLSESSKWVENHEKYKQLEDLEVKFRNTFVNMDAYNKTPCYDKAQAFLDEIKNKTEEIEATYSMFGSLFRYGRKKSYFGGQIERFADLYSHTCINLLYYPFCYFFLSQDLPLSHESTLKLSDSMKLQPESA